MWRADQRNRAQRPRGKRRAGLWLVLHAAAICGALRITSPRHDLLDADCEHDFVLGSTTGGELPLTFEANAHSPHGVAVYVDEKPVGVARMWVGRGAGDLTMSSLFMKLLDNCAPINHPSPQHTHTHPHTPPHTPPTSNQF